MENILYKRENKMLLAFHTILAMILLLWANGGVYTYVSSYIPSILLVGIYGLWILISILSKKNYIEHLIKYLSPLIFFILIIKVSSIYADNINLDIYFSNLLYIIIISSIAIFYIDLRSTKINKALIMVLLIDIIYVGINTSAHLKNNPLLSRYLSTGSEIKEEFLGNITYSGIGDYTYFYSIVMIVLALVNYLFIKNNNKASKVVLIITIIFFALLIIQAQFTIAILLLAIFIILMILNNVLNKVKNKDIIILGILVIFLLAMIYLPNILKSVYNLEKIPNEIRIRIEEIYNAITQNRKYGFNRFEFKIKTV